MLKNWIEPFDVINQLPRNAFQETKDILGARRSDSETGLVSRLKSLIRWKYTVSVLFICKGSQRILLSLFWRFYLWFPVLYWLLCFHGIHFASHFLLTIGEWETASLRVWHIPKSRRQWTWWHKDIRVSEIWYLRKLEHSENIQYCGLKVSLSNQLIHSKHLWRFPEPLNGLHL